jgi:hypothetical protein
MAKVTYGSMITALTGSIGGVTFQNTKAGSIARLKPSPRKFTTAQQQIQHQLFTYLLNQYQLLSDSDKLLWKNYANLYPHITHWGEGKTVSGLSWFMSQNYYRYLLNGTILSQPAPHGTVAGVNSGMVVIDNIQVVHMFDETVYRPNEFLFIYTTPPIRESQPISRKDYRFTKMVNMEEIWLTYLTDEWKAVHGMNYPPQAVDNRFSISFMLFVVSQDSYLSCVSSFYNASLETLSKGIPLMEIEKDFLIM